MDTFVSGIIQADLKRPRSKLTNADNLYQKLIKSKFNKIKLSVKIIEDITYLEFINLSLAGDI